MPAQSVINGSASQTSQASATSNKLLSVWLKTAMLLLLGVGSAVYAAPPTLEIMSGSAVLPLTTSTSGQSVIAYTNQYQFNIDNPTQNTAFDSYFPKTRVTYSLENQQFGADTLVFGSTSTPNTIFIPLSEQGGPINSDLTSSRLNVPAGTGIDTTANYGMRILANGTNLAGNRRVNTSNVNGGLGYWMADVVVRWNRPVFNPIINLTGMGGRVGSVGLTANLELIAPPSGTSISALSGRNLIVSGLTMRNNATRYGATTGGSNNAAHTQTGSNGGASGSVQVLNTNPITLLRFRVYLATDFTTDFTTKIGWDNDVGDAFLFSASSVDSTVGDLYVSKTNNTTSLIQGTNTTYTVRVTNAGPSTIATPVLKDSSGTGLTATAVACSSASGNKCTAAPSLASLSSGITIASLASGEFYEVLVTSNVTASSGNVTNTATVELPDFASSTGASCATYGGITRSYDQTTGTCTSTDTDAVITSTDLAIDKTGTSSVIQGGNVSYTIKVWNKGPTVASSSTFTDTVPAALTSVSWSCSASGSALCGTASGSGNTINVTTGTLPVNTSSTPPIAGSYLTFNVTGTASTVGSINNTASIAVTSSVDPVSDNNSSTFMTTVTSIPPIMPDPPQQEARFTIVPNLPTIYRGQAGQQLIDIKNEGPNNASGTVAAFKLRPQTGVTVTSVKVAGGSACSVIAGAWSCPVGSVANGGTFQLEVSYDTTSSAALGTAIQADIKVNSNEFNPGSGAGETLYKVWGSTNPTPSIPFNETRPNGAFALGYGTANANENVNLSTAWLPSQTNPTGAYLTQGLIGSNNSVFGSVGAYDPMISRIVTNLNSDTLAKTQTLLSLDPSTQAGDNRRAWELTTGIHVPAGSTASFCVGNTGGKLDDGAYIMLNGVKIGNDGKYNAGSTYIQNSVPLLPDYNRITYRIANRNTPGSNEDFAQGLYGEIGLSINGGACTAANLDATASIQIPASINIIEQPIVTVSGIVFEDNSGSTTINSNAYDGTKQAGELGIAGSTVTINNCTNTTAIATTQTNANGEYTFSLLPTDLPADNFCIAQQNLDGYSSVSGTAGYTRATDTITVPKTPAVTYPDHNFGDARLNAVLTEDGQQTIIAGGVADYPHRLTAQSVLTVTSLNQTNTQQPANSTDAPWQTLLYRDTNCNGKVDSGENFISVSLPLSLKANEQVCLVQRVYAPATASMGAQHIGQLQASFSVTLANPTEVITGASIKRQDTTLLGSAGLSMQKAVRSVASCPSTAADTTAFTTNNQAQSGGYLEYEITYRNNSLKNLVDVSIKDSVPVGTVFKNNTCQITPSPSTCSATKTGDALLWQNTGTLLPSQQGQVRFCVQVLPISNP